MIRLDENKKRRKTQKAGRPKVTEEHKKKMRNKYKKFSLVKPLQDIPYEEEWRLVKGKCNDSLTYVSNYGRVKWVEEVVLSNGKTKYKEWLIPLKKDSSDDNDFYYRCTVQHKNPSHNFRERVHVLGCRAFFEKPNDYDDFVPNHIDGIKSHNYFGSKENDYKDSNIEWVTRSENTKHAYRTGLATKINLAEFKGKYLIAIDLGKGIQRQGYVFKNAKDAEKYLNVPFDQINQNVVKKTMERCHGKFYARVNAEDFHIVTNPKTLEERGRSTIRKFDELNRVAFPNELKVLLDEICINDEIKLVPIYDTESGKLKRVEVMPTNQ